MIKNSALFYFFNLPLKNFTISTTSQNHSNHILSFFQNFFSQNNITFIKLNFFFINFYFSFNTIILRWFCEFHFRLNNFLNCLFISLTIIFQINNFFFFYSMLICKIDLINKAIFIFMIITIK